jgi:hypothetical protein
MSVVKISNRRSTGSHPAVLLMRERIVLSESSFVEMVIWKLPRPLPGSSHAYKYRIAYVDRSGCVVRFDNESGKGDHVHIRGLESPYAVSTIEALKRAFFRAVTQVRDEDGDS